MCKTAALKVVFVNPYTNFITVFYATFVKMYVFADLRKSLKRLGLLIANPLSATFAEGFANVTNYSNFLRLA
jgi:hypothetical protein